MIGIYQIKNKMNGHSYVGQSVDIKHRWCSHLSSAKSKSHEANYPLYKAFRKYGTNAFEFIVLEEVANKDELLQKETKWYNIINPEYNQKTPEQNHANGQKQQIYQIDMSTLEIVGEFSSITEASRFLGKNKSPISKACNRVSSNAFGYYWCKVEEYDNWEPEIKIMKRNKKKVFKIDKKSGNILTVYNSMTEAGKELGVTCSYISQICRGAYVNKESYTFVYGGNYELL